MAEQALTLMTVDEFLSWDDGTETRYELADGVIHAMSPPGGGTGPSSSTVLVSSTTL